MKHILMSFILLLTCSAVWAADLEPSIQLNSIEVQKNSEEYGDELYLVITKFGSDGSNSQYTIPEYPITWPSESLHQINNITVWEGIIENNETEEIIIELIEHDVPPYNVDDTIGSIRIKLKNNNGQLNTSWEQNWHEPSATKLEKMISADKTLQESYTFKGDGGDYNLTFMLKNNLLAASK